MDHKGSSQDKMSPLAKARHLGSAKSGTHHWLMQRISAIGLLGLGLWFLCVVALSPNFINLAEFSMWLQRPLNSVLMILLLGTGLYHSCLGIQVVIEDYIHREFWKHLWIYFFRGFFLFLFTFATFAILKVHSTHPGASTITNTYIKVLKVHE